jgi:hypothetical protein
MLGSWRAGFWIDNMIITSCLMAIPCSVCWCCPLQVPFIVMIFAGHLHRVLFPLPYLVCHSGQFLHLLFSYWYRLVNISWLATSYTWFLVSKQDIFGFSDWWHPLVCPLNQTMEIGVYKQMCVGSPPGFESSTQQSAQVLSSIIVCHQGLVLVSLFFYK